MKFRFLLILLGMFASLVVYSASPKVIAHRGYWTAEGSAQNSIRSLVKADSIGCFATEFDVWMTADSILVINHDADINGVIIQDSPSEIVLKQRLNNNENIPTLESFLDVAKDLDINLVLELKAHDSRNQETEALKKSLELVKKYGLEKRLHI